MGGMQSNTIDKILRQRPASEESAGESGDTAATPQPGKVKMEKIRVGKGQKAETTRDDRKAGEKNNITLKCARTNMCASVCVCLCSVCMCGSYIKYKLKVRQRQQVFLA